VSLLIRGDSHGERASLTQPKIFATRAIFLELCTCRSERRRVDYEELSSAEIAKRAIAILVRTLADHKVSVLSRLSRAWTGMSQPNSSRGQGRFSTPPELSPKLSR